VRTLEMSVDGQTPKRSRLQLFQLVVIVACWPVVAPRRSNVRYRQLQFRRAKFTMKIASLFALASTAAAFAPASQTRTSTALAGWKDEMVVGILPPVGFFDPLGLSKNKDDDMMNYYREAELKNGRVAMAACLGWFVTAPVRCMAAIHRRVRRNRIPGREDQGASRIRPR
jgi:Chlorophyll A-B binding protein